MVLATREKLKSYIDTMPEQSLQTLEQLVEDIYWQPVVETDLTEEERESIRMGMEERKTHPENFKKWQDVRKG